MSEYICKEEVSEYVREVQKTATLDISRILGDTILKFIEICPTADVAPVVHGHWEEGNHHIRCSVCHTVFFIRDYFDIKKHWHSCPNCFTRMDKSEETCNE